MQTTYKDVQVADNPFDSLIAICYIYFFFTRINALLLVFVSVSLCSERSISQFNVIFLYFYYSLCIIGNLHSFVIIIIKIVFYVLKVNMTI